MASAPTFKCMKKCWATIFFHILSKLSSVDILEYWEKKIIKLEVSLGSWQAMLLSDWQMYLRCSQSYSFLNVNFFVLEGFGFFFLVFSVRHLKSWLTLFLVHLVAF